MKKLFCVMLCFLLLLSTVCLPRASAFENQWTLFQDAINVLRWHAPYWNVAEGESFPVKTIMSYTSQLLCIDEYGENLITNGDYSYYATYVIPADIFEAMAVDSFAVVDISALRSYTSFFWDHVNFTGIDNFQHYQPDRHVYVFSSSGGMGDPSWYEVLGYTEADGAYAVYSRFVSLQWDTPTGEEGVDYIVIDGQYYAIEHYLRTVMTISNGRAQFHSWEETDSAPDVELMKPLHVIAQDENITIAAESGVFPADAVIEIGTPDDVMLQTVSDALSGVAEDFVAYDITASVQPNGVARVTFAIPEGFEAEKLALFHIADDGTAQQLEIVVNAEDGTLTAQLAHFSVYAVAQLAKADPLPGDVNGDGKVNARDARLVLRYAAELVGEEELDLSMADYNGDGKVNARDAREILRYAAGLE